MFIFRTGKGKAGLSHPVVPVQQRHQVVHDGVDHPDQGDQQQRKQLCRVPAHLHESEDDEEVGDHIDQLQWIGLGDHNGGCRLQDLLLCSQHDKERKKEKKEVK